MKLIAMIFYFAPLVLAGTFLASAEVKGSLETWEVLEDAIVYKGRYVTCVTVTKEGENYIFCSESIPIVIEDRLTINY